MFVCRHMDPGIEMLKGSLQATTVYKQGLVKMKEADWAILESRLNQWGFENPNQLCHAVVASQFPKQQRSEISLFLIMLVLRRMNIVYHEIVMIS